MAGKFLRRADKDSEEGGDKTAAAPSFDPLATFEQAQYVQSVLEAVRRSAKTRQWTQVNIKDGEDASAEDPSSARLFEAEVLAPRPVQPVSSSSHLRLRR